MKVAGCHMFHVQVPPTSQWSSTMRQPSDRMLPENLLLRKPSGLGTVPLVGQVLWAQNSLQSLQHALDPIPSVLGYEPPLFPWNANPGDSPTVDNWLRQIEQICSRIHFPEHTASYKHGCHRLQFPPLHYTTLHYSHVHNH